MMMMNLLSDSTFKNVFISTDNADYILELVLSKYNITNDYKKHIYKNKLTDLQNYIYENFFPKIVQEISQKNPNSEINLEELLLFLNKLTINNLESILKNDHVTERPLTQFQPSNNIDNDIDINNNDNNYSYINLNNQDNQYNQVQYNQVQYNQDQDNQYNQNQNNQYNQDQYNQDNSTNSQLNDNDNSKEKQNNNVEKSNTTSKEKPTKITKRKTRQNNNVKTQKNDNESDIQNKTNKEILINKNQIQSSPQIETQSEIKSKTQPETQPEIKSKTQPETQPVEDNKEIILSKYYHFFSKNVKFDVTNGSYTFPFGLQKIVSLGLSTFKLKCNLYNITNSNNKFFIYENDNKLDVIIPEGYYNINTLLSTIHTILNTLSNNKYNIAFNKTTQKVHFSSENNFNIVFHDNNVEINANGNLKHIFGFEKNNYINNNIYVSENHPNFDNFSTIYLKLYLNNKELQRINTNTDFNYFYQIPIHYNKLNGGIVYIHNQFVDPYDIYENIDSETIKIELYDSYQNIITKQCIFDFVLSIDYSSTASSNSNS
jgi:hypothetical protein